MKEEIKGDAELAAAFRGETAADVLRALEGSERGRRFLDERLTPYRQEFGYKAIWSHEFSFPTWKESPAPIVEAVRGYLETDYDYPAAIQAVRDDLGGAQEELFDGVPDGEEKDALRQALELSLRMNPLTPDHHFFIDQGTNARVRIARHRDRAEARRGRCARRSGGRGLPPLQRAAAPEREPGCVRRADARLRDRRDERERQALVRPPSGSAPPPRPRSPSPTGRSGASRRSSTARRRDKVDEVHGLGASPGVVEGVASIVASLDEFDQVQQGEILVCQMTNPAWVVLFTKIAGLVTDAGGVAAHPAVVAREFGIPAVVGTSVATRAHQDRRPHPRERRDRRRE